ncbi:MAG TPA: RbsD/FucU domain-containing protein [Ilumatobacteraceae bacterium]|nr:RbsD/FucU domain-containing protein [Ilumatobacteraceae bacterium]HRB03058.1 RbsD/FucU domain-containing protein [Ilumatobacteraceae bacterium]
MLYGSLIHPGLLAAVAGAGHGARVVITDANFPASTQVPFGAPVFHLNLSPGVATVTQVLSALVSATPVEAVCVMRVDDEGPYTMASEPEAWAELRSVLPDSAGELDQLERASFYEACSSGDVAAVVVSGDQRWYANVILTIGVR